MNRCMFPAGAAILLGLATSACGPAADPAADKAGTSPAEPPLKGATIGGAFSLVDQDGRTVTDRDFAGRYRIMYFGYTFCPDVCPVDLQVIARGLRLFEGSDAQRAARITPIMVTIDPARDTPAVMKQYVAAFHPRLIGLSGTPTTIAAAAKAYGIYYARRENSDGGEYLMDHSNQAYLFGPDGQPIALLPTDKGDQAVAAELRTWVR